MWLLTPEEIIAASKETANMPEDWCRRQLNKVVEVGNQICGEHHEEWRVRSECTQCLDTQDEELKGN